MPKENRALVVLSGGQDSATCLAWAAKAYDEVLAISFNYGQRHRIELEFAAAAAYIFGAPHIVVDVPAISELSVSALVGSGEQQDVNQAHDLNPDLPASFVPNRNAMFLTLAHAYAQKIGAGAIVTGVCQTDYSGYPDCRLDFVTALENALNLGADTQIAIIAPLMHLTKAETWKLADDLGEVDFVINHSLTCYEGDTENFHEWGFGCGNCPACLLRSKGWEEFKRGC